MPTAAMNGSFPQIQWISKEARQIDDLDSVVGPSDMKSLIATLTLLESESVLERGVKLPARSCSSEIAYAL